MGQKASTTQQTIDEALSELEQLADEIQVKLHLAGMDAKDTWEKTLEPKLYEARAHARDAKDSSKRAVRDVVQALKAFSESL